MRPDGLEDGTALPSLTGNNQEISKSTDLNLTVIMPAVPAAAETRIRGHRLRALLIAFVAQNVAFGLTLAPFGALQPAINARFPDMTVLVSSGLSLVFLSMGLLGPVVGAFIQRFSIRTAMGIGITLLAVSNLVLAATHNIFVFLVVYAGLVGPGVAFLGLVPAITLVNNWFSDDRGKAMGIATTSIAMVLMPPTVAALVSRAGLANTYILLGVMAAMVAPLFFWFSERADSSASDMPYRDGARSGLLAISPVRTSVYGLSCLALGLLIMPGTMLLTHLIPIAIADGASLQEASFLSSIYSGAGLMGALSFGWLADRYGSLRVLAFNALFQAAVWTMFLPRGAFLLHASAAAGVGLCVGGVMALFGTFLSVHFGSDFARRMGFVSLFTLPFNFLAAPFTAYLVKTSGGYAVPVAVQICLLLAAAAIFLIVRKTVDHDARS